MIFSRLFYPLALVSCAAASPTPELVSRGTVGNDKIGRLAVFVFWCKENALLGIPCFSKSNNRLNKLYIIDGFPQTVPSGTTGKVYLAYQPALYVENGCVPFPAVDSKGNTK